MTPRLSPYQGAVLRPYAERIRARVFALLQKAGIAIHDDAIVAKGTSDDATIAWLKDRRPDVLVVPFHAHRTAGAGLQNGMALALRIANEIPALSRTPIIMPVSQPAEAAVRLILSAPREPIQGADPREVLFVISEADLTLPETAVRLTAHLHAHLGQKKTATP